MYQLKSIGMDHQYNNELLPLIHRILDIAANNIHLQYVPSWPRDSLPKSPIVQKLILTVLPVFYPWWTRHLEIEYEQFGPYSPIVGSVFEELLEDGQCIIAGDSLEVGPASFDEQANFPEITEIFIQYLINYCTNPILTQFETIEVFSIIAVEQEPFFRSIKVLRRMSYVTEEQKKKVISRVMKKMLDIPHLRSFIHDRGDTYARNFVSDTIDAFYDAISHSGKNIFT